MSTLISFTSETSVTDTQFPYSYKYSFSLNTSIQESEISMIEFYTTFTGSEYYSFYYPVIYTTWYRDPCRRVLPAFINFTRVYIVFGILCTKKFTDWEFYLYMNQEGYNWFQNWKGTQQECRAWFVFYKKSDA